MDLKAVSKLLKDTKREDLIKIIAALSEYNSETNERLLNYCEDHCEEEKDLVVKEQIQHYWDIAMEIIDEANRYGGTYYKREEEAYDALNIIDKLAQENITPWTFRRQIIDEMMEQFYYGNSGFDDSLVESCEVLCRTKEEKLYLADSLVKSGNDYYKGVAANIYLSYGKDEAFIEVQSKNLHYGSDYIKLADYYKKHKQADKAVALIEKALSKADGRMDEVYIWLFNEYKKKHQEDKIQWLYEKALIKNTDASTIVELMYKHYTDDYDRKKEYLLKMVQVSDSSNTRKWLDECRGKLKEEDFKKNVKDLYKILKKKNVYDYLQLRIDEGETKEVYEYLKDNPHNMYVDTGHNITKQISDFYPKEICNRYWKECESLCLNSNKGSYRSAVSILVEIKGILIKHNLSEEWVKAYTEFLKRHKRKKLLMGYIREEKKL